MMNVRRKSDIGLFNSPRQVIDIKINEEYYFSRKNGEVAEWLNVPDSKSGVRSHVPRVRIPPSPPGIFSSETPPCMPYFKLSLKDTISHIPTIEQHNQYSH